MTKKKAKGKKAAKKATAKQTTTNRSKKTEKQVDLVAVRKSISNIVGAQAKTITKKVVQQAKDGQLATMKYLFEMAGVYPPSTDDSGMKLEDDSLAKILLDRMNIPFTPLPPREDDEERVQAPVAKVAANDAEEAGMSSEDADSKVEAAAGNGE
jgi:hypothetical protein